MNMTTKANWLRSEIDKLEGMKKYELGPNARIAPDEKYWNQALTSIITRYKEELKVLESK